MAAREFKMKVRVAEWVGEWADRYLTLCEERGWQVEPSYIRMMVDLGITV